MPSICKLLKIESSNSEILIKKDLNITVSKDLTESGNYDICEFMIDIESN